MGILDGFLGQLAEHVDVKNLAERVGLQPDQVEAAIHALAVAHPQPGDTAEAAATATGLPTQTLQDIVGHIGGEGSLASFASLLGSQGGIEAALGGLASNFLGKA
jgi:hypothetical protein